MKTFYLELDEYERDNLLWLLDLANELGLNSGDWHHQIRYRLRPEDGEGNPNVDKYETAAILERTGQIL